MRPPKHILVRLPNWLGDMVMSSAFLRALHELEPNAHIEVIAKKQLATLAATLPGVNTVHAFSKSEHKGISGAVRFAKSLKIKQRYDLFFCLPNSFSSAAMAYFSGAKVRIGHRKEMRGGLLTKAYSRPTTGHRVLHYIDLLEQYYNKKISDPVVQLDASALAAPNGLAGSYIAVNFNSEAQSRRVPEDTAAQLLEALLERTEEQLVLVGGPKDANYTRGILDRVAPSERVLNLAGNTNLSQLTATLARARFVLTTDSGPAHLANATGVKTIVLFGPGDETNTAPFNVENRMILRSSTPCQCGVTNTCKLGTPPCMHDFAANQIIDAILR